MRSMLIGATGMQAQELNVEVISNNIANISTSGFKRQRAEFQDMIYENIRRPGSTSTDAGNIVPTGIQVGMGVRPAAVYRINSQGNVTITDNPLDISVSGRGFFQVQLPDGTTAYTRAGSMQLNADGVIVNADGYPIQPSITIPSNAIDVTINSSGEVLVKQDGTTTLTNVGQLQLATFVNPAGLEAIGNNLLRESPASGTPTTGAPASTGFGEVRQGSIENSNVNVVSEITSLITAQRAYEMNSRVIKASDEMLSTVSQLR
ncbi:MAG: flagellar basal-body rod protein FlgG [Alphaproteobacteria bacterium]|nr:flagellar basal-body rod protein FlgG [Alphaproteobacteria bacterium]